MDPVTKGVLVVMGFGAGFALGWFNRPIPVPRNSAGYPLTQVAAVRLLGACDACDDLRPLLLPLSQGRTPSLYELQRVL